MGLFDKRDRKRRDDFDSPIEQVDLGASPPRLESGAPPSEPLMVQADGTAPTPTVSPASLEADDYGIEKAIELMRTLPDDNVELVVRVVKVSLESVGIKLPVIIEDAARRQQDIQSRIAGRRAEIADLEQEIQVRRDEIERLEADHRETTMVRERLELAEGLGGNGRTASPGTGRNASKK